LTSLPLPLPSRRSVMKGKPLSLLTSLHLPLQVHAGEPTLSNSTPAHTYTHTYLLRIMVQPSDIKTPPLPTPTLTLTTLRHKKECRSHPCFPSIDVQVNLH
jgi:hypothetical protein